jgi:uncharacterized tellurite resistance protein B-like protein
MFAKFLALFTPDAAVQTSADRLQLATALLFAKAGLIDGEVSADEHSAIVQLLRKRFSLSDQQSVALFDRAITAAQDSVELFSHTKIVKDALSYEERLDIIEMLWEVVYADGHLHDFEANLMRRVTGLLYVEDKDSGTARKRVLDRLKLS